VSGPNESSRAELSASSLSLADFFFQALDTEAYQVGLWAGEGDQSAVESPVYRCSGLL